MLSYKIKPIKRNDITDTSMESTGVLINAIKNPGILCRYSMFSIKISYIFLAIYADR